MGLPEPHDQPVLILMQRTLNNLDVVTANKFNSQMFEVTQLINSFAGVVAHPWDQLLDEAKLEQIPTSSQDYLNFGFPEFVEFPVLRPAYPATLYKILNVLRNSMAHGNMTLLDRNQLHQIRPDAPIPQVREKDIAGIELWNQPSSEKGKPKQDAIKTWHTALSIIDLRQCLDAMYAVCRRRDLWQDHVRISQEQRDVSLHATSKAV